MHIFIASLKEDGCHINDTKNCQVPQVGAMSTVVGDRQSSYWGLCCVPHHGKVSHHHTIVTTKLGCKKSMQIPLRVCYLVYMYSSLILANPKCPCCLYLYLDRVPRSQMREEQGALGRRVSARSHISSCTSQKTLMEGIVARP